MVSVTVIGVPAVATMLKKANAETKIKIVEAIKEAGFYIGGKVVDSIAGREAEPKSVDTGRFMGSVKTTFPKSDEAKVESNVEYAKFLEYGTSRMMARNHFRNTADREKKKVEEYFENKLKKL